MTIKAVLLDLDGTVYQGNSLIKGADTAINHLRDLGFEIYFCTNNSSTPRKAIQEKLKKMGIECNCDEIISSGHMAIQFCLKHNLKNVFFSGSETFGSEFLKNNINLCEPENCDCLVIGMDTSINYLKLTRAVRAALYAKTIVLCNQDRLFPKEDGIYPGCGLIASAVLYCSGKQPDIIVGKPGVFMPTQIAQISGLGPKDILVIGDSPETDIAMADNFGSPAILVGQKRTKGAWISDLNDLNSWSVSDFNHIL